MHTSSVCISKENNWIESLLIVKSKMTNVDTQPRLLFFLLNRLFFFQKYYSNLERKKKKTAPIFQSYIEVSPSQGVSAANLTLTEHRCHRRLSVNNSGPVCSSHWLRAMQLQTGLLHVHSQQRKNLGAGSCAG